MAKCKQLCSAVLIVNMRCLHFSVLPENFVLSIASLLSKAVRRDHIYEELPKGFVVHCSFPTLYTQKRIIFILHYVAVALDYIAILPMTKGARCWRCQIPPNLRSWWDQHLCTCLIELFPQAFVLISKWNCHYSMKRTMSTYTNTNVWNMVFFNCAFCKYKLKAFKKLIREKWGSSD